MEEDEKQVAILWWSKMRIKYNVGLVVAGLLAFIAYVILGGLLIAPYDYDFEITIFTLFFQGAGYVFMLFVANLFYYIGQYVDLEHNTTNSSVFRKRLFNWGFWFSVSLPFLVPLNIIVEYFIRFA